MADAEREARIKITTVADGSGAKETAKDLQDVEKATQAVDKVSKDASRTAEELTKQKRAFRDVVKGLALEVPHLSRILGLLANPFTALAAAASLAAGKLLEWKKSVDEASSKQAALESLDDSIKSIERTLADFEAQAFADELKRASGGAKEATDAVKRLNDEIEFHQQLQDQLQDKGLALSKARIKERVAKGQLTEVQGLELTMQLEDQARGEKLQRVESAESAKLSNIAVALKQLEGVQPIDPEEMAAAKHQAERQRVLAEASARDFAAFSAKQGDKISDLGAEYAASLGVGGMPGFFSVKRRYLEGGPRSNEEARAAIQADLAAAERELELQRRMNEDRQRQADDAAILFGFLETDQRTRSEMIATRTSLQKEFETLNRRATARRGFHRQAADIEWATGEAAVGEASAKAQSEAAKEAARFRQSQDAAVNSALHSAVKQYGATGLIQVLIDAMQDGSDVWRSHKEEIQRLRAMIKDQRVD